MLARDPTVSTDDFVRALCRAAAARAVLVGSLAGCAPLAQAPTSRERTEAAVNRSGTPFPDHAAPSANTARDRAPTDELDGTFVDTAPTAPSVPSDSALPLRRAHVAAVRSAADFRPFHCDDAAIVRCALSAPLADGACRDVPPHDPPSERARMLQLAEDTDFLSISVVEPNPVGDSIVTLDHFGLWARAGTECAGASDHLGCVRALADTRNALNDTYTCSGKPCSKRVRTFGVATRGDRVIALRRPSDFRTLLGTIDTPAEAWLMLMAEGEQSDFPCNAFDRARHRKVGDHYELVSVAVTQLCVSGKQPLIEKEFTYRVDARGKVTRTRVALVRTATHCVVSGRRPAGFTTHTAPAGHAGDLLAHMAELERASVRAFVLLARELTALAAPAELVARARAAARDEVRHARVLRACARRLGGRLRARVHAPHPPRDVLAIALENVREGCVRELFGAMTAHVQRERAGDPALRAAFGAIADDEATHAALALDLHAFFLTRLAPEAHAALAAARADALAELRAQLIEPSAEERAICGMPTLSEARALFDSLAA